MFSLSNKRQMVPPKVAQKQSRWQREFISGCSNKTKELVLCIPVYIQDQTSNKILHSSSKYYNTETTNWNRVPIDKSWIEKYDLFNTVKVKYEKNKHFNKALKDLERAEIIVKDGDAYMVNPLYLCANSNKYINMYNKWCALKNKEPNPLYLENSIYEYNGHKKLLESPVIEEINILIANNIYIYNC